MTLHYTFCDPARCGPPVHRSAVVLLPTFGLRRVETFLRHMDGSPFGTVVVVDGDLAGGFSVTLDTLKLWVAELDALTQPRVGVP